MGRSNNWADGRNLTESHIETTRGMSGTTITVNLDFSTADSVGITVTGITGGGFKKVNVFLADHHDNQVSVSGTTANVAKTVKSIAGFNKNDDLRVIVFAVKSNEITSGDTPLLATSQPDNLVARENVTSLVDSMNVVFVY